MVSISGDISLLGRADVYQRPHGPVTASGVQRVQRRTYDTDVRHPVGKECAHAVDSNLVTASILRGFSGCRPKSGEAPWGGVLMPKARLFFHHFDWTPSGNGGIIDLTLYR